MDSTCQGPMPPFETGKKDDTPPQENVQDGGVLVVADGRTNCKDETQQVDDQYSELPKEIRLLIREYAGPLGNLYISRLSKRHNSDWDKKLFCGKGRHEVWCSGCWNERYNVIK